MVGPPAPLLRCVDMSVIPKNGVSSAPEYVVGMEMCGSPGRSAYDAPGVPACCSTKKHTALPRSAHDPPPNDTTESTPSLFACCTAAWTALVGTWERTPSNVPARDRASLATTRSPSSELRRPVV